MTSAFLTGAIVSLHCVGMCGPIACSTCMSKGKNGAESAVTLYHAGRIFAYTLIGLLCGKLGAQPLRWFFDSPAVLLPWILVAVLLCFALGIKISLPRFILHRVQAFKFRQKLARLKAWQGALAMGLATPLLPCGPLYLIFGTCLVAGSARAGAEFAFAFALGTLPLLLASQYGFHHLRQKLSALTLSRVQRSLAFLTALIIAFRLFGTLPDLQAHAAPAPVSTAPAEKTETPLAAPDAKAQGLPSCCH